MSRGGPEVAGSGRASDSTYRTRSATYCCRFRTTATHGPERLPSDRLELCSSSGLGSARRSRASPRPAPCRSPRALVGLVKGLRVASSYPALRAPPCRRRQRDRAIPRERCLSPTSATDSRLTSTLQITRLRPRSRRKVHEHVPPWACASGRQIMGDPANRVPGEKTGGASLDGEPPASVPAATIA
jgi:hypothetical protein